MLMSPLKPVCRESTPRTLLPVSAGKSPTTRTSTVLRSGRPMALVWRYCRRTGADIYVQDLLNNELIRVTDHPAIDTEPAWSKDGRSIVFMSDRTGQPQIYQMEVGASSFNVERLTYDCFQCMKGQFCRTVSIWFMFEETRQSPNYQIAVLNIETLRVH